MNQFATPRPAPAYQQPLQAPVGYKAPQPVEVYILNDHANASIPQEIREQFHRDEHGRVLFFTAPPLNTTAAKKDGQVLGHSARYLAAKAERDARIAAKRKADEANATAREEQAKKARAEEAERFRKETAELSAKAVKAWENQLALATKQDLEALFNSEDSVDGIRKRLDDLAVIQKATITKNQKREARLQQQQNASRAPVTGMTVWLE